MLSIVRSDLRRPLDKGNGNIVHAHLRIPGQRQTATAMGMGSQNLAMLIMLISILHIFTVSISVILMYNVYYFIIILYSILSVKVVI